MLKYLIAILILVSVIANSAITVTSTQYRPNVTLADSGVNANGMIRHCVPSMVLTSDGSLLIEYYRYVNSARFTLRILKTSDKGTTWITDTLPIDTYNQGQFCPIYTFGNDAYIMSSGNSINDSIMIRKYTGITQGILDTLNFFKSGDVGKNGLNVLGGDTILFWVCKERITDTTFGILTRNFGASATYTEEDIVQFNKGTGPILPMLDGLIKFEYSTEDVFWVDSLYGYDTISTAFFFDGTNGVNVTTVDAATNPDACVLRDSTLLYVAQGTAAGYDSLISYLVYITGTLDATPGNITLLSVDTATIEAAADMMFTANTSTCAQPKIVPLKGTDTCFVVYMWWADQANPDSANIVMKMSTTKGGTWGSRTILKPAVNTEQVWHLSVSNAISYNGYIEFWASWGDSITGTGNDSLEGLKVIWDSGVRTAIASGVHYNPSGIMNIYTPAYVGKRY